MILLWGPELIQIYNDGYREVMGAKHPAGLAMPTRECWPEVWAFNAPLYARVTARGEAFMLTDQRLEIRRNGNPEEAFFTLSYSPVPDDAGAIGGVLVTVAETTAQVHARSARELEHEQLLEAERSAREEAEHRAAELMAVIESMPDAVYIGSYDGISIANQTALDQLGFSTRDELMRSVGTLAQEIATRDTRTGREIPGDQQAFSRALRGERVVQDVTVRHRVTGEDRVVRCAAAPVIVDGKIVAAVAINADVTEIRQNAAERERLLAAAQEARAEADAANQAKGDFLAVMSHELRTPLNAIGGYTELLQMGIHGAITPEQNDALERIQRSQRHLLGLINGVLNYARADAGAVNYAVEEVLLGEVLAACEALIAPQMRARQLAFASVTCPPEHAARADREKVQQVVLNLLSNAAKFTEPGGRVTLACEAVGDGTVRVHVADTGNGIPPDQLERVFQPFVQVDAKLTRTREGTGLGLAISRDLARGMGGDLTAESEPGRGSTFTLTLPAT